MQQMLKIRALHGSCWRFGRQWSATVQDIDAASLTPEQLAQLRKDNGTLLQVQGLDEDRPAKAKPARRARTRTPNTTASERPKDGTNTGHDAPAGAASDARAATDAKHPQQGPTKMLKAQDVAKAAAKPVAKRGSRKAAATNAAKDAAK